MIKSFIHKFAQVIDSDALRAFAEDNAKYFTLARSLSEEILAFKKEKTSLSSVAKLAFGCSFYVVDFLAEEDSRYYFGGDKWKLLSKNQDLAKYVFQLLQTLPVHPILIGDNTARVCEKITVDGLTFGWARELGGGLHESDLYIDIEEDEDKIQQFLRDLFWKSFSSHRLLVEKKNDILVKEDTNHDFIPYTLCDKISGEIKEYLNKGFSHSEIYTGAPGVGKSNLMRGIAHNLGKKSMRFLNLEYLRYVYDFVEFFQPDVIMIDDIDRYGVQNNDILTSLENLAKSQHIVVLVTANRPQNLEDATIRAGRFSRMREIKNMDPEVVLKLVDDDQELFDLCRELPVACIQEIMKRVRTFGKSRALGGDIGIEDILQRAQRAKLSNQYTFLSEGGNDSSLVKQYKLDLDE